MRRKSALFRDTFYDTTLPPAVVEAVAANLTILKSPTVLRQTDGRLWCFEGCSDNQRLLCTAPAHMSGTTHRRCAISSPTLERSLRQTEFHGESQDERGHQTIPFGLPIRPVAAHVSTPPPTANSAAS